MHQECLRDDILARIYERLGDTTPQTFKEDDDTTHTTIGPMPLGDRKSITAEDTTRTTPGNDGDMTKERDQADENGNKGAAKAPQHCNGAKPELGSGSSSPFRKPVSGKGGNGSNGRNIGKHSKPYDGLFEAKLRSNEKPISWEIGDLRKCVEGGDRMWLEMMSCLVCHQKVE